MSVRRSIIYAGLTFSLASLAFSFGGWITQRQMRAQLAANDARLTALAEAAFANSTMSADEVAAAALRAVERGQLYCLPMRDARIVWRLKRLIPQRFARLVASRRLQQMAQQRAGVGA